MRTLIYINKAKEKAGSWKALAELLGIPQTTMSNIKNGSGSRKNLTEHEALVIAQFLEIDPGEILKARAYDLAGSERERQMWLPFLSRAAVVVMTVASAFCVTYPRESLAASSLDHQSYFYYVKLVGTF